MLFNKNKLFLAAALLSLSTPLVASNTNSARVVDFAKCFEESKYGVREKETLETMKNQMENAMKELNNQMTEISGKLNNEEVREQLSPEAEKELAERMQTLSGEMQRYQQQYYYMMQQANMRTMNVIADKIKQASAIIAKQKGFSMIINKEQVFHYASDLDVTEQVISNLDEMYANEESNAAKIKAELSEKAN